MIPTKSNFLKYIPLSGLILLLALQSIGWHLPYEAFLAPQGTIQKKDNDKLVQLVKGMISNVRNLWQGAQSNQPLTRREFVFGGLVSVGTIEALNAILPSISFAKDRPITPSLRSVQKSQEDLRWKQFFKTTYNRFLIATLQGKKDPQLSRQVIRGAMEINKEIGKLIEEYVILVDAVQQDPSLTDKVFDLELRLNQALAPLGFYTHEAHLTVEGMGSRFGFLIYEISYQKIYSVTEGIGTKKSFLKGILFLEKISDINVLPDILGQHIPKVDQRTVFLDSIRYTSGMLLSYVFNPAMKLSEWHYHLNDQLSLSTIDSLTSELPHLLISREKEFLESIKADLEIMQARLANFYLKNPQFPLRIVKPPVISFDIMKIKRSVPIINDKMERDQFVTFFNTKILPVYDRLSEKRASYKKIVHRIANEIDASLDEMIRQMILADLKMHVSKPLMEKAKMFVYGEVGKQKVAELVDLLFTALLETGRFEALNLSLSKPLTEETLIDLIKDNESINNYIEDFSNQLRQANNWWKEGQAGDEKAFSEVMYSLAQLSAEVTGGHEFWHAYDVNRLKIGQTANPISYEFLEASAFSGSISFFSRIPRISSIQILLSVITTPSSSDDLSYQMFFGHLASLEDINTIAGNKFTPVKIKTLEVVLKGLSNREKLTQRVKRYFESPMSEPRLRLNPNSIRSTIEKGIIPSKSLDEGSGYLNRETPLMYAL